jgi:Na+/melibiose symporter-like transporter
MFAGINTALDPILIMPFQAALQATGNSTLSFFFGAFVLCVVCTLIGELCMAGAYYLNRRHFAAVRKEMVVHNNLSIQAIAQKDKESFKACNKLANDAFGLNFFSGITVFAASVWPAFFALGWLDYRFEESDVMLFGFALTYAMIFVPMYILTRIVFGKFLKKHIWPFNAIMKWTEKNEDCGEKMMSWSDLIAKDGEKTS